MTTADGIDRRSALLGGLVAGGSLVAPAVAQPAPPAQPADALAAAAARFPALAITAVPVLELLVEVGARLDAGAGPLGQRWVVPITGGRFRGRGLAGRVLPGGADRQLVRPDGIRELHATYELAADDGAILMVDNQVIVDERPLAEGKARYARSVVRVHAPAGPHDWLNRRLMIGTLDSLRPAVAAVFLRFHQIG